MTDWNDLASELDAWAAAGETAELWWRDDDAVAPSPALDRLLDLRQKAGVPLTLAVIPARAEPGLARRLADERFGPVAVVQHGWAHLNHAAPGQPKAELGSDRPASYVLGELARGQWALDALFERRWLRVLVPPHNRLAAAVATGLAGAGYAGVSAYGPRRQPGPGLVQVNAHVDIMEWVTTRAFRSTAACLDLAIAHLAAKREGRADPAEPTGLLTHHLAHDGAAWDFIERFLSLVTAHPATRWDNPESLFGMG